MARDPYKYFRVEAKELVEQLSRGVLDLEQGASGKELVARLLRVAHTLKGAAHVVKRAEIGHLAHQLEDALVPYGDGQSVRKEQATAMLRLVDGISAQLASLAPETPKAVEPPSASPAEEFFDSVRVDIGDMDVLLDGIGETGVQVAGLKARLAAVQEAADLGSLLLNQLSSPTVDGTGRGAVRLSKARALAEDLHTALKPLYRSLTAGADRVERELAQVRDTANQLRLVPVSAVFPPLRRAIRNTAQTLGKQVEFETSGGEHRLDAHVLAAVRDALLHVVRNAVAHGIEGPQERAAAGKPAGGKVSLVVQQRGNRVAFACRDDGRGFDLSALRGAALERGLLSASDAEALTSDELIRLILRGGISTSGTVTEVSGRGIGLDVLRETAARLKASVAIVTNERGTTVELSVPVSLMSLSAVIVRSGGVEASVPLDSVQQTLQLTENEIVRNPDGEAIVYRGKLIPFVAMTRALGQDGAGQRNSRTSSAVVVRSGDEVVAVGVDRLLGADTVLLRRIPPFAGVDPVIAGAALDAEGNPQLVLDPAALVVAAHLGRATAAKEKPPSAPVVLVIDDSLTTRILEKSILESAGYEVDLATSGEEAMEKAHERPYNLFVVDIEMPGMDGFEFIARARNDAALSSVPAILVSSRSSPEDRRRGAEAGARAYIAKNEFDQGQLLQVIRKLVS